MEATLEKHWNDLRNRYSGSGITISKKIEDEVSKRKLSTLRSKYQQDKNAGLQALRDVVEDLLQKRQEHAAKLVEKLVNETADAELRNAGSRKVPLKEKAVDRAQALATNLDIVQEFCAVSYEEMAALTGISKSALYKMIKGISIPNVSTLHQVAIAVGVPIPILLFEFEDIKACEDLVGDRITDLKTGKLDLKSTADQMMAALEDDPDVKGDPGTWMVELEEVANEVSKYYDHQGAILASAIGRHHGGVKGAWICARMAKDLAPTVTYDDLGGFVFPSEYLKRKIGMRLDGLWPTM